MKKYTRLPDWENRLRAYLATQADRPFKWGDNDCALFAAGAIEAMTGHDPAEKFRGKYDDELTARTALRELGAGTLYATVRKALGKPKPAAQAQRGDIVMRDRTTCGVCVGATTLFPGEDDGKQGLVSLPTHTCQLAFSLAIGGDARG